MDDMVTREIPSNEVVKSSQEVRPEVPHDCEMCTHFGTREIVQEMLERERRSEERKERLSGKK